MFSMVFISVVPMLVLESVPTTATGLAGFLVLLLPFIALFAFMVFDGIQRYRGKKPVVNILYVVAVLFALIGILNFI